MRRSIVLLALLLSACLCSAQTWSDVQWGAVERGGRTFNKALAYLPVQIEGIKGEYRMLLDTTVPGTVLFGPMYRRLLEENKGRAAVEAIPPAGSGRTRLRASFTLGSFAFHNAPIHLLEGYDPPETFEGSPIIGTVGLDLMQDRIWLIETGRGRFSIFDAGAALPKALDQRVYFFDAVQRDERLFIPISQGASTFTDFLFDTTANVMPVLTTNAIWQKLTGRWGDEKNNQKLAEKEGDADVVYLGYRTSEPIRMGSRPLGRAAIYTLQSGPDKLRVENWPFRANGVIGLSGFNGATLIIDLPKNHLGLLGPARKG